MRHVCIHGHFYQPPREHPALETIELQEGAHPWHDWNERINAECYAPNTDARILDGADRIVRIVNNYARMSFDFGPTLLSWLARRHPRVYRSVLEADRDSARRFGGHGSAMAQAYNHAILPLANERDRRTQVRWGVRDFELRFGRAPEGMWLPETAADTASLAAVADEGIRFTVLAPGQAAGPVDTTRPYAIELPGGKRVAVFFYDQAISGAIAFGGLLSSGAALAARLEQRSAARSASAQIVNIATDGETYGHHHAFGDLALAWTLDHFERHPSVRLTNYGEFLERHPPREVTRLVEPSAWSCAHGVGRWDNDCGCASGAHPAWHQRWRRPLRLALDELRDALIEPWARAGGELLHDPWLARDGYIDVVLDRSADSIRSFFERHARRPLSAAERVQALELLELQRNALLMYTSCAWFFDDVSGIETIQVLRYADRVLELARRRLGLALERAFLERLATAPSNVADVGDARQLYERRVRPARIDARGVATNVAAGLVFDDEPALDWAAAWEVTTDLVERRSHGNVRSVRGSITLGSRITTERHAFAFAARHDGEELSVRVGSDEPDTAPAVDATALLPDQRLDLAQKASRAGKGPAEAVLAAAATARLERWAAAYAREPDEDRARALIDELRALPALGLAADLRRVQTLVWRATRTAPDGPGLRELCELLSLAPT